jgi:hypothetical protein
VTSKLTLLPSFVIALIVVVVLYVVLEFTHATHPVFWTSVAGVSAAVMVLISPQRNVSLGLRMLRPFDWGVDAFAAGFLALVQPDQPGLARLAVFLCAFVFFVATVIVGRRITRTGRIAS